MTKEDSDEKTVVNNNVYIRDGSANCYSVGYVHVLTLGDTMEETNKVCKRCSCYIDYSGNCGCGRDE